MHVLFPTASFIAPSVPDISSSIRLSELVSGSQDLFNNTYILSCSLNGLYSDFSGSFTLTGSLRMPHTGSITYTTAQSKGRIGLLASNICFATGTTQAGGTVSPYWVLNPQINYITVLGQATSGSAFVCLDPYLNNEDTLTSVDVVMRTAFHPVSIPATQPVFSVYRFDHLYNASLMGTYQMTASSAVKYHAGGALQTFHIDTSVGSVIDKSTYTYHIGLIDEYGANSVAGNEYVSFILSSSVPGIRPF